MTAAGLIFSNIHDASIPELTRRRTMASVPFGCRYRLIDFALSNFVNSDITKVGIITHYNYQSLLDHIGTGKDWDLARRSGGIKILPPFITAYENAASGRVYTSRLEALMGVMNFISRCTEDYIVLSDCDVVCNIDLKDVIRRHEECGADITVVTKRLNAAEHTLNAHVMVVDTDDDGKIRDFVEYTGSERELGEIDISTNIMVMKRTYLQDVVLDSMAHGYTSFYRDIIGKNKNKSKFMVYRYDGFYELISSMESYFACSMKMLEPDAREQLFGERNRPILTKVRNSAPTKYSAEAKVVNSLIADGCVIEGKVENSIIFRGVHIGRGTVVKNCVMLQDTYVGDKAMLNCVVTDKNVLIKDGRRLSGHESMPFFIGKGISV
ncbi:MAG: glucose-1-phosphate adenylyltransferase subunit GlgD [Clostridia bacterium]|nr:glucose-1-phosphate adenylyltransferase subunit GlgD [Clostridia bacterium]